MLIIQKFGGSSLAGPERLRRAASIISAARRQGHAVIAVVSAMTSIGSSSAVIGLVKVELLPSVVSLRYFFPSRII